MSLTTEAILEDYLERRITFAEFERQMRPWLDIGPRGAGFGVRFRQPLHAQVPVAPSHVLSALADFAAGTLPEDELVLWATMVDMLTEFGPGAYATDEETDRLEPMWDVIVNLTSPAIFGELTRETVAMYAQRLRDLESELSRRAV